MRAWWRDVWSIRSGVWLHLEEVVWVIFKDEDVMFLGATVEVSATLRPLACTRRILASWDSVEESRFLGASLGWVPGTENVVHVVWKKAFGVHLDTDSTDGKRGSSFDGGGEGVLAC